MSINEELWTSFEDISKVLPLFGFRGVGYALSFEKLTELKTPVIVYIQHRRRSHFSVLRGIDDDTVWLAAPSLGNQTYSNSQFLELWETRGELTLLKGKILAVVPTDSADFGEDSEVNSDFFTTRFCTKSRLAYSAQYSPVSPWL